MRLAFLCSGLEPGRDGIGDHARALAQACAACGHPTRLAAVRDPLWPTAAAPRALEATEEIRLRDIFREPAEAERLRAWLAEFQPDWVSAHFTPFGFHPRGLGGGRARFLRELLPAGARRHLMLHEIWLQPGAAGRWRDRALGWLQRRSVDAWTGRGWQPAVLHTQARLHRARLRARGAAVELLPLFSTFPASALTPAQARAALANWARENSRTVPPAPEDRVWIGHFGSFHADGWDWAEFFRRAAHTLAASGRRACFLALGRSAAAERTWVAAARAVPAADFCVLGEIPGETAPVALQACDAAFTSTPWDVVEKSSAVAAWRAQGVPVLVPRAGATPATQLPAWPDGGIFLADGAGPLAPKRGERIAGPAFLRPAHAAQTFLAELARA